MCVYVWFAYTGGVNAYSEFHNLIELLKKNSSCTKFTAWQTGVTQHHFHWLKIKSRSKWNERVIQQQPPGGEFTTHLGCRVSVSCTLYKVLLVPAVDFGNCGIIENQDEVACELCKLQTAYHSTTSNLPVLVCVLCCGNILWVSPNNFTNTAPNIQASRSCVLSHTLQLLLLFLLPTAWILVLSLTM